MEKEKIIAIFKQDPKKNYIFKNHSVNDLICMMEYLELNLKTKKGNWSVRRLKKFNNNCFISDMNIKRFYLQYAIRKKRNKVFENFTNKLGRFIDDKKIFPISLRDPKPLKIIDKENVKLFLEELKLLKAKYLSGSNENLLDLISTNIETGLQKTTLRNYFYKVSN